MKNWDIKKISNIAKIAYTISCVAIVLFIASIVSLLWNFELGIKMSIVFSIAAAFFRWIHIVEVYDSYRNVKPEYRKEKGFLNSVKMNKIMMECYVKMYKASNPSADFKKLVKDAKINERGQKEVDFMAYEISEEKSEEILSEIVKKYNMCEFNARQLRVSINLGCSPRFSQK